MNRHCVPADFCVRRHDRLNCDADAEQPNDGDAAPALCDAAAVSDDDDSTDAVPNNDSFHNMLPPAVHKQRLLPDTHKSHRCSRNKKPTARYILRHNNRLPHSSNRSTPSIAKQQKFFSFYSPYDDFR